MAPQALPAVRPDRGGLQRLLEKLTAEQAQAATYGPGPQVINAGPGSGKTRTLIARVLYLILSGLAQPSQILVLTFTNQAAGECLRRIRASVGPNAANAITVSTFHALGVRILRRYPQHVERRSNFTIYDERDLLALIEYLIRGTPSAAAEQQLEQSGGVAPAEVQQEISLAKSRLWDARAYREHSEHPAAALIAALWAELDRELQACNAVGFDDLLCYPAWLLSEHPLVQRACRKRWQWLLVDEVQDLNAAQVGIAELLAGRAGNLTVVGDIDQSLYRWRGADPAAVAALTAALENPHTVALSRNFRSKQEIVQAAARLIEHNHNRPALRFSTERGSGGRVQVRVFENEYAEAGWIARAIDAALKRSVPPSEVMVLGRTSLALQPVLRALAHANIKHRVLGSLGIYDRAVVKDALAYLTLLANPHDAIALRRALAAPRRGAADATVAALTTYAREHDIDLLEACAAADQLPRVAKTTRANLQAFAGALGALREQHAGRSVAQSVVAALTMPGGLVEHHKSRLAGEKKQRQEAERALEDLRFICRAAAAYQHAEPDRASLVGFLERAMGLHAEALESAESAVLVSTIHRAKGSEARVVYLCAAEDRVIPSWRAAASQDPEEIEQERCAFYVAITRAKEELTISWCTKPVDRPGGVRSRFIPQAGL